MSQFSTRIFLFLLFFCGHEALACPSCYGPNSGAFSFFPEASRLPQNGTGDRVKDGVSEQLDPKKDPLAEPSQRNPDSKTGGGSQERVEKKESPSGRTGQRSKGESPPSDLSFDPVI